MPPFRRYRRLPGKAWKPCWTTWPRETQRPPLRIRKCLSIPVSCSNWKRQDLSSSSIGGRDDLQVVLYCCIALDLAPKLDRKTLVDYLRQSSCAGHWKFRRSFSKLQAHPVPWTSRRARSPCRSSVYSLPCSS